MIQRREPEQAEMEPIVDEHGQELWLPADLVLVVCSLCNRFCTRNVPLWCRDVVRMYERHRMLAELAARPTNEGRPQCRECLAVNSLKPSVAGHQRRVTLADHRRAKE
jgi:hypothetical protein